MSEESPIYYQRPSLPTPSVDGILAAPDTSVWLKAVLRAALARDPVDAARDAELLATVLKSRADTMLAEHQSLARVLGGGSENVNPSMSGSHGRDGPLTGLVE